MVFRQTSSAAVQSYPDGKLHHGKLDKGVKFQFKILQTEKNVKVVDDMLLSRDFRVIVSP